MRILLSNDDGIHAPGLAVLEKIARQLSDDVWIVAPETDQSGKAHSLTLHDPLRVREIDDRRFAVGGTPTDCVIMALRKIMPEAPDLILSGVNRGANIADDVTYSGTVACAMEGTILGVKSIALSQSYGGTEEAKQPNWQTAEAHGADVIRRILASGIPEGILMNVNFPACAPDAVTGIEVTSQCTRLESLVGVEERIDARDNPYYWLRYRRQWLNPVEKSDMWALSRGAISVTPLRLDLTDHGTAETLRKAFG